MGRSVEGDLHAAESQPLEHGAVGLGLRKDLVGGHPGGIGEHVLL
jgi:hypothetical protein